MPEPDVKTILLVEDEALIALNEAMKLKSFGYEVHTAHDADEAVLMAEENHKIDLVLMDIDLGAGTDGAEAAERILGIRNLPIVFLTSHVEEEYVERVKRITRFGYIIKNSGDFVLKSGIEMAFELFEKNRKAMENESRYRMLFENSISAVGLHEIILDEKGNPEDYIFLEVNAAFETHTELRAADIINKRVTQVYPDMEKPGLIEVYGKVALTGEPVTFETFFKPSGRYFNIAAFQAGYGRFAVMFENITERRQSEEQLRTAQKLAHLGSWSYDLRKQKLTWTAEMFHIFGLDPKVGEPSYEDHKKLYYPEDWEEFDTAARKAVATGEGNNLNVRIIRPSGEIRHINTRSETVKDERGNIIRLNGTCMDTTDRVLGEMALEKALREKEQILRELQHRAKNSFHIISSLIRIKSAQLITDEAKNMADYMVAQITAVSDLYALLYESGTPSVVRLDDYCLRIVTSLRDFAGSIDIVPDMDITETDAKQAAVVGLILTELITNAIKHAFPLGKKGNISVSLRETPQRTELAVIDDGIGLTKDFNRDKPGYGGLSIVNLLAEQLQGKLEISVDRGTTARLTFDPKAP